ncbi:MAG: cation diffusion facilitator family transporter [Bacteroidaceae bacterium]|nr:cation diffusion facilitator family transporter [Bacteroidaceae bacterium]MEA5100659.1 cation diffusion facilitator family transporter [Bacteroidales bacterium]
MSKENSTKNIRTAFFLNLAFAFVELIGGIITNSVAILSDAVHDFGDSISLAIAWALQKKSNKAKDDKYSYGYKRFSLLSSVILSGILLVGSILILVEAIGRLFNPQEVNAQGMLWLAILGIIVNGLAALSVKRGKTLNERAVFLHIMEDVLGWIGVLVISIVMIFVNLPILDPILSISITIWVLYNVYKNLKATFNILLQAFPKDVDVKKLTKEIEAIDNVISIHDLHIWTQDGNSHVMTLHIVAEKNYEAIKLKVREMAKAYNIDHVTIELEDKDSTCEEKTQS